MAEKTAWERVLDEPVIHAPGERPMKAQVDARFDGSFKQLVEWMSQTFKNPDDMRVRVIVGNFPMVNEVIPTPEPEYSSHAHKLKNLAGTRLSLPEAEDAIKKIQRIAKKENKIGAIKACREVSGIGLKEAKEFVEALPPYEEEIPF